MIELIVSDRCGSHVWEGAGQTGCQAPHACTLRVRQFATSISASQGQHVGILASPALVGWADTTGQLTRVHKPHCKCRGDQSAGATAHLAGTCGVGECHGAAEQVVDSKGGGAGPGARHHCAARALHRTVCRGSKLPLKRTQGAVEVVTGEQGCTPPVRHGRSG